MVGGSYIGLEFGQIFKRFGSEVSILEQGPRLMGREDEDVSAGIHDILVNEGIKVHVDATSLEFAKNGDQIEAQTGGAKIAGSHVLIATGRQPNTDDLGLENTSIKARQTRLYPGG